MDIRSIAPILIELVKTGVARPDFIVRKEYAGLYLASEAYRRFDQRLETKVVFKFPWHDEDGGKARATDEEDAVLGREHELEAGGELDPHGAERPTGQGKPAR